MKNKSIWIIPLILIIFGVGFFVINPECIEIGLNGAIGLGFCLIAISIWLLVVSIINVFFSTLGNMIMYDLKNFFYRTHIKYGSLDKKELNFNRVDYYREVPTNFDFSFWIIYNLKLSKKSKMISSTINALLLQMVKDENIKVDINKNNEIKIYFLNAVKIKNENCKELYAILKRAANDNEILEPKELRKWCCKNFKILTEWMDRYNRYVTSTLIKENLLEKDYNHVNSFFITKELFEEIKKIQGFKKFLMHFGNMEEKEFKHIELWENYLIYAQLLCISDKVNEQLSKFNNEFEGILNSTITFSKTMSYEFKEFWKTRN